MNVDFRLLKTIHVDSLVCYLNKLQNARCNDKDTCKVFACRVESQPIFGIQRTSNSLDVLVM